MVAAMEMEKKWIKPRFILEKELAKLAKGFFIDSEVRERYQG